uniref:Uncharacterized protein n=1 Tax=Rhizophora mucronata TaxID=61149 RepID=A0A2P2NE94_RHIMU
MEIIGTFYYKIENLWMTS